MGEMMAAKFEQLVALSLLFLVIGEEASVDGAFTSTSITRHHKGDLFTAQGEKCYDDLCLGMSSGTAGPIDAGGCNCQCMPNLPIFRDDLHICVDDIQECSLVPFQSGTTTQKVPYVFLPLKGQIVYPSAEIIVSDVANPICVISGSQFLGRRGWVQLRNNTETELPFRLFRDDGRTYLQWLGENDLRLAMEGRVILVHLMCKDASGEEELKIFTPCVAFRVAGNPSGPREMMFATDKGVIREGDRSLSVSEYIAIGVCILLLGLIYVASLAMYFYYRKNKKGKKKADDGTHLTVAEEGIVKSNPLLQATRRHLAAVAGHDNVAYASDSGSCSSESDRCSDIIPVDDENRNFSQNMEISAMVHPCNLGCHVSDTLVTQDSNNIEKLPEEDVSIVETLEVKEDRPETVRSMGSSNVRKKLYFNPAYFELDLLKAPPPAAIEFLTKIREVIAVAKHKMSAKRFSPSLIGIPEEEYYSRGGKPNSTGNRSVHSYNESTERKKNKKSCRGCSEEDSSKIDSKFNAATNESCCPSDTKQRIIRKWLEDVPFVKSIKQEEEKKPDDAPVERKPPAPPQRKENKKVKAPAPPPPPPPIIPEEKESTIEWKKSLNFSSFGKPPEITIPPPPPPPPPPTTTTEEKIKPIGNQEEDADSVPRIQGKDKVPPVVAKNLMDAVIQELIVQRKNEKGSSQFASGVQNFIKKTIKSNLDVVHVKNARNERFHQADKNIFEMDSLERNQESNDQREPEIDENGDKEKTTRESIKEIDSFIQVYKESKNETIDSVIETTENRPVQDDHDYEVILLNPSETVSDDKEKELKIYNLPEILSKNERSEGYSLVSEVYVNDGYSYSSDGSSHSKESNSSKGKNRSPSPTAEKSGRLTIHVKDSPENYRKRIDETANFEPDTLDRKPGKFKYSKTIGNWEDSVQEQYSNQRFHEMDLDCSHNGGMTENFVDSLERPRISLRSCGSFRRNEKKCVEEMLRNFDQPLQRHFGSLREIYEAKSRGHRKRTETSSLIGSVPSEIDCRSTLSWSEDRRNKLLHRGIVLHVAEEIIRNRKSKPSRVIYPDVVPPRPPKPVSLSPNQRSTASTPGTRSYCASPTSCVSPPPRSNCASPRPMIIQFPPPPPPPPRSISSIPVSPSRSGRNSPDESLPPQPPPRRPSPEVTIIPPPPRVTSSMKWNPISPTPSSPCTSPIPPPRILNSPPLPPRSTKPPLPPKNVKSTRQRNHGRHSLARRPLPPLPSPRNYQDSTLSSVSSRDLETLSMLSGASIDSLNSSDYEAFYTLPYDGQDGEIFEKNQIRTISIAQDKNQFHGRMGGNSRKPGRSMRIEDSGYLSTDSDSCRRRSTVVISSENGGSQGSETEESLCDGASESGAESIATDSFFFGNFNRAKTGGSLDSGVGSEVNKCFGHSFGVAGRGKPGESGNPDLCITVRQ